MVLVICSLIMSEALNQKTTHHVEQGDTKLLSHSLGVATKT